MSVMKAASVLGPQELRSESRLGRRPGDRPRVYERCASAAGGYTTVMTTMTILDQKGFLKTTPAMPGLRHRARQEPATAMRAMVNEFLNCMFGGSANPLMLHPSETST